MIIEARPGSDLFFAGGVTGSKKRGDEIGLIYRKK
jgi:hypothetical protein